MAKLGHPALHFYMTRGMARALGINLSDALRDGRLAPERYADMVTRCRACAHAVECQTLLAATPDLEAPPLHCANGAAFSELGTM